MAIDVGFRTEKPFQELEVTRGDLVLGSIVFGWFLGFVVNVVWTAVLETRRSKRISYYIVMIWLEILADLGFSITTWLYLYKVIPPGLDVFLTLIICWILQVSCLMFIIVNRLCIIIMAPRQRLILKATVIGIIGLISISSACIWIPAQLQINHQFMALNHWWDRFEKSVYLCLDLALNIMFIVLVKKRLVDHGLKKYLPVFKFNLYIIFLSISMDIVLLGVTALKNGFVYCQFHPVVYIVKLQIEMNMSQLLVKVAQSSGLNVCGETRKDMDRTQAQSSMMPRFATRTQTSQTRSMPITVQIHSHVCAQNDEGKSPVLLRLTTALTCLCVGIELKEAPLYKDAKAFEEKPQSMVPEHSDSSSSV
ncbi:hypothetical protein AAF712_001195 [Marasmius tenuissimus]|uniref:Integral membrane protein n=1 Tax=Marasmius tenuissimus TaxID=585030 RepID=A0ABR3AD48_9AGAR